MFNTYTNASTPPTTLDALLEIKATLDRIRGSRPIIDVVYADAAGLGFLRRITEDDKTAPPPVPSLVAIPLIEVADEAECRARLIVDAGDGKRSVGIVGDSFLMNFKDKVDAAQQKPNA